METSQTSVKAKKFPKLTKKQKGFVDDYVLSGNGQKAALNNYEIEAKDKENVARAIASENLTKPNVALAVEIQQQTLKSALQKQGVTPEKIAEKIDNLLEATHGVYKNNNATKQVELVGEEPDYQAIDKGLKHAKDIYGVEDLDQKPKSQNTYNFIFSAETQDKVRKIEETIKAELIKPHVESV